MLLCHFDKMGRTMKDRIRFEDCAARDRSVSRPVHRQISLARAELHHADRRRDRIAIPASRRPAVSRANCFARSGSHCVILTAHHLICDGWSLDLLIRDFCAFFQSKPRARRRLGAGEQLPRLRSQRSRAPAFQRFQPGGNLWHRKFCEGFPMLVLPTDHPRNARRDFRARCSSRPIPASVVQDLRTLAAKQGCSFFAVLLSSLAIFFARVSRQRHFVIALPTADQPVVGKPGLVGHCVNLLPIAMEMRDGEAFSEFLKRVQCDLLAAPRTTPHSRW